MHSPTIYTFAGDRLNDKNMRLSDLHTGEHGIIVKVTGHGGFRKRIVEMGFIKGKKVEVLLNAPLMDPVKYKIMGYEVSLRHSEADQIEVVPVDKMQKGQQQEGKQNKNKGVTADPKDAEDHALIFAAYFVYNQKELFNI